MRLLWCFILWSMAQGCMAEAKQPVGIDVSYYCLMRNSVEDVLPTEYHKVLHIVGDKSWFHHDYSHASEYISEDSDPLMVWKNVEKEGKLSFVGYIAPCQFAYSEPVPTFDWEMIDQDSVVCDYPCKKACTTFRGRTWTVWYTYDIPCSDGPWKLCGLPGLILKATDAKGDFSFTAFKIAKGDGSEIKVQRKNCRKSSPQSFAKDMMQSKKDKESFYNEMAGISNNGSKGKIFIGDNEYKTPSRTACLLEMFGK